MQFHYVIHLYIKLRTAIGTKILHIQTKDDVNYIRFVTMTMMFDCRIYGKPKISSYFI